MAKTFSDGYLPVSFWADADLSAKQYYCVTAASTVDYVKTAAGGSNPYPLGVLQDDAGDTVGDAVSVKTFGFTKAVVAACDIAGNACAIKFSTVLRCGSSGYLYATGGGDAIAHAQSMDTLTTGSGILNVLFWGAISGCAVAAS